MKGPYPPPLSYTLLSKEVCLGLFEGAAGYELRVSGLSSQDCNPKPSPGTQKQRVGARTEKNRAWRLGDNHAAEELLHYDILLHTTPAY